MFTAYDAKKKMDVIVKATGSATLTPQEGGGYRVFVYLAPKGLPVHARCVEL